MKKLAWITDPHLNFVEDDKVIALEQKVLASGADSLVITGDVAEAPSFIDRMRVLQQGYPKQINFVLGNHDCYGSSIDEVRYHTQELLPPGLSYLTALPFVELTPETALVGEDGWYDGRNGLIEASRVFIADFQAIDEIRRAYYGMPPGFGRFAVKNVVMDIADRAVACARAKLVAALNRHKNVIFATHIPPFEEAATYKGKVSDYEFQPYFSCQAMGDMLLKIAEAYPDNRIHVLCGHSHGRSQIQPRPNLEVWTGEARYRSPKLNAVLDVI